MHIQYCIDNNIKVNNHLKAEKTKAKIINQLFVGKNGRLAKYYDASRLRPYDADL